MSNSRVGFGDGTIKTTAQLCADTRTELNRLGRSLQNEISQLQGKFGGQGAQAFASLNTAWDEKQTAIVSTLDRFEASLNETEKSMTSQDEGSASSVAGIKSAMEGVRQV